MGADHGIGVDFPNLLVGFAGGAQWLLVGMVQRLQPDEGVLQQRHAEIHGHTSRSTVTGTWSDGLSQPRASSMI